MAIALEELQQQRQRPPQRQRGSSGGRRQRQRYSSLAGLQSDGDGAGESTGDENDDGLPRVRDRGARTTTTTMPASIPPPPARTAFPGDPPPPRGSATSNSRSDRNNDDEDENNVNDRPYSTQHANPLNPNHNHSTYTYTDRPPMPLTPSTSAAISAATSAIAHASAQRFRHTLGVALLMMVVVLWVTSNFITSALFSDDTYSKPFFVAYVGSGVFCVYLIPWVLKGGVKELVVGYRNGERPWKAWDFKEGYTRVSGGVYEEVEEEGGDGGEGQVGGVVGQGEKLGLYDTIRLSVEFSILWFLANYLSSVCYVYTNVASGTILGSTSSVWTLLFCAIFRVERFSWLKALSVATSLLGVLLISKVDVAAPIPLPPTSPPSPSSTTPSDLPPLARSAAEILLGNLFALLGAVFYGIYVTLLKVRVGDESRLDVHLLFGFSGLIIVLTSWPVLILFHVTGLEVFELPAASTVWVMLGINFAINVVSDFSWAYAMLLTTPLLATMGLSMSIPLALLGQMLVLGRFAGWAYWGGAGLVFVAFLVVAGEERRDEREVLGRKLQGRGEGGGGEEGASIPG